MTFRARRVRSRSFGTGFSLVEATVSVLIVGGLLVAAMNTVGAAKAAQYKTGERSRGLLLAQALMAEILQQAYEDPAAPSGSFGTGADEAAAGNRSLYDDVDDYYNWSASPPENKDGSPVPWADGYERVVNVSWVDPSDLTRTSGVSTGVKRILVTVRYNGRSIVTLSAVRTKAWQDPATSQGGGG